MYIHVIKCKNDLKNIHCSEQKGRRQFIIPLSSSCPTFIVPGLRLLEVWAKMKPLQEFSNL
jgi:hypothetical protein